MAQTERQQAILEILRSLRDLDRLKRLFWQELNYERENRPLSPRQWPESARQPLDPDPVKIGILVIDINQAQVMSLAQACCSLQALWSNLDSSVGAAKLLLTSCV